jgi:TupA-like ATPgrasp
MIKMLSRKARNAALSVLPDRMFLIVKSGMARKVIPNVRKPRRFTDHILNMMVGPQSEVRRAFGNKLQMREFVAETIGEQYLPKLYGVYRNPGEFDISALPGKFAFKANHGCGMNKIVFDKAKESVETFKGLIDTWVNRDSYRESREYIYGGFEKCAFAEELLEFGAGKLCYDYKLFCFNGQVKMIQVVADRDPNHQWSRTESFYDEEWNILDFNCGVARGAVLEKPELFEKMKELSYTLAKDFNFLRVDMYLLDGRIYIGELTSFPNGSCVRIFPKGRDEWLGSFFDGPGDRAPAWTPAQTSAEPARRAAAS